MKKILFALVFISVLMPLHAAIDEVAFFKILKEIQSLSQNATPQAQSKKAMLLHEIPQNLDTSPSTLLLLQATLDKDKNDTQTALHNAKSQENILKYQMQLALFDAQTLMLDWLKSVLELRTQSRAEEHIAGLINATLVSLNSFAIEQYEAALLDLPKENPTLIQQFENLQSTLASYKEVLDFLNANSALLLESYLFDSLGLEALMEHINSWYSFSFWRLDFGKIIVCAIVLAVFWCFRRILAVATVKAINAIFHYQESKEKQQIIITSLVRPISWILFFNGFDICWDITYYPQNSPEWINKVFDVLYIMSAAWFVVTIIEYYGTIFLTTISRKKNKNIRAEIVNLILKVMYSIVVIFAALGILARLGFNISAIIASFGIGGLAVAFAAKDILANFFASVMILFDNAFSQGDWISCNKVEGTVVEIGLRRTTIRTFDNALLFVPNSLLVNDAICNWNRRRVGRRIRLTIGLTYDATAHKLQQCIDDIKTMLTQHPQIAKKSDYQTHTNALQAIKQELVSLDDYEGNKSSISVYLDNFGDSTIDISISCFSTATSQPEWAAAKQSVLFEIMHIVEKNGLSFAFPSQSVYVENLPKDIQHLLLNANNNT